jgi:hypothetical protein
MCFPKLLNVCILVVMLCSRRQQSEGCIIVTLDACFLCFILKASALKALHYMNIGCTD